MKAYKVRDRMGYSNYSVVVFADTPGKSKSLALGTDEFCRSDWDYTELTAERVKALDSSYRGRWFMDWDNMQDRVALVRYAGFRCDPDYADLDDCKTCDATGWCGQYESMMEDREEMEALNDNGT